MLDRAIQKKANDIIISKHENGNDLYPYDNINAWIVNIADHAYHSMAYKKRQNSDILDKMSETFTQLQQKHGVSVEDLIATAHCEAWQAYCDNNKSPLCLINGAIFKQTRSKLNTAVIKIQRRIQLDANMSGEIIGKLEISHSPDRAESKAMKKDRIKYIFDRLSPEEVKLIKCYATYKDIVVDGKVKKEASIADIRAYMQYGNDVSRTTMWRKMKRALKHAKTLWKEYDIDGFNGINSMDAYSDIIKPNRVAEKNKEYIIIKTHKHDNDK